MSNTTCPEGTLKAVSTKSQDVSIVLPEAST